MKLMRSVLIVCGVGMLVGCGDNYDGTYIGSAGLMTKGVMELADGRAVIHVVMGKKVLSKTELEADIQNGKLILTREDGGGYVYRLGADEKSLECMSDTCNVSLLPGVWSPYKRK